MNARSDTPTPTTLTSEAGGVSIKIEQGVLCENNDECARSRYNTDMEATPIETYKPINPAITENNSINVYIKAEPDVDIDDRHPDEEAEENTSSGSQSLNGIPNIAPKIRLTPTSKLIASPNGSTGNKKRYVCTYENCTKSYGKSSHLRSHLTWHTGIKPFVCKDPSCGKGFTRSDELNRHVRTHTGEKPFECVQCTKKFSRSDHLTKHLVTHTKRLAAKNGFLAKKIKKEKNLIKQTPIVPAVANDNQDIKFENAYVPETEFNSANFSTNRLKATGEDNLRIKVEQPENKGDLISVAPEQHIKIDRCIMSPIPRSQTTVKEEFPLQIKPEPLEESNSNECPDMSNEPDDDEIMPEANLPPIIQNSTIVAKSEQPLLLKQSISHMTDTVYDPSRPFPCHHCTKNFKRLDDLNRHMRTHTGEKPFNCTECDKRFMRSDHLKKHLKTHARMNRNPNANEILCTNSLQTSASSNETYVS